MQTFTAVETDCGLNPSNCISWNHTGYCHVIIWTSVCTTNFIFMTLNTSTHEYNGHHFEDDIFKCIILIELLYYISDVTGSQHWCHLFIANAFSGPIMPRNHSVCAPKQWEMALHYNTVSHRLGTNSEYSPNDPVIWCVYGSPNVNQFIYRISFFERMGQ